MPELKKIAKKVNPDVHFTGRISDEELLRLLQKCEIFALPSETELQGICLLEAMSCGKPTVVSDSDTSAAKELANLTFEHKNYHDLAEKIIRLIKRRDEYNTFAKLNREIAINEHDYSKITDKFLNLYSSLITNKKTCALT
jgi:N,N'-diacetylbacillosaminyl-diphospho-undecaprenol alpha-1,3-N-acetylgalactosaminyltransferase